MVDSFVDQVEPFVFVHNRAQKRLLQAGKVDAAFFGKSDAGVAPDADHRAADVFAANAFVNAALRENLEEVDSRVVAAVLHVQSLLVQLSALILGFDDIDGSFVVEAVSGVENVQAQDCDKNLHCW